jgi:gamma-glutamyltranspeptidase/glutathione hydrolase
MRDNQYPGRSVVMCTRGMVATSQPMATQVGLDILKRGGNAVDAAVAACATLAVTEPHATGIGGDCFLLYHEARSGRLHGLNGSGRAPAAATPEAYRARGLAQVPETGILSVTVPGAVDAWDTARERFGTMGLDELLAPAIEYADEGYVVSPVVGQAWRSLESLLAPHVDSSRALLVDGRAPAVGTIHRQPLLARTLKRIAREGRAAFYGGAIGEEIVRFSRAHDGLLALEDFAAHRSEWVEPIATDYRGVRVFEIPPNGQGITALMTLNILEQTAFGQRPRLGVEHLHYLIEAFKLAVAERDTHVCDPAFHAVPVDALLSKAYARDQAARIDPQRVLGYPLASNLRPHRDTVYLTVVDRDRNAVSLINSLYYPFGSLLVAGDTGVTLQNRGAGFVLDPEHANCIAPRKRPLHTIIPAMAYRNGKPLLAFGVMGGEYQAMGHAYVFSNWLDFGLDLQEAIDAPRFLPGLGVVAVERSLPAASCEALRRRGHVVVESDTALGGAQAIYIDNEAGVLQAASDPRKDGCALGY